MAVGVRLVAALVSAGLLVAALGCAPGGPGVEPPVAATTTTPQSPPSKAAPTAEPEVRSGPAAEPTSVAASEPAPAVPVTGDGEGVVPAFRAQVGTVSAAELGASWHEGCPVGPEELRVVEVTHWGYDGEVRTGRLVVAAELTDSVTAVIRDLYEARFPIERMRPTADYGGDDDASMAANNTSAFNCRAVTGGASWSEHSYGRAIDVNPLVNPYVAGSFVAPPGGSAYLDRDGPGTGLIRSGDATVQTFGRQGWHWGGAWAAPKDYQHFSTTGR